MKVFCLDISEDSPHGEASRAAMQTYAYRIERVDKQWTKQILEAVHEYRRRILGEFSKK